MVPNRDLHRVDIAQAYAGSVNNASGRFEGLLLHWDCGASRGANKVRCTVVPESSLQVEPIRRTQLLVRVDMLEVSLGFGMGTVMGPSSAEPRCCLHWKRALPPSRGRRRPHDPRLFAVLIVASVKHALKSKFCVLARARMGKRFVIGSQT